MVKDFSASMLHTRPQMWNGAQIRPKIVWLIDLRRAGFWVVGEGELAIEHGHLLEDSLGLVPGMVGFFAGHILFLGQGDGDDFVSEACRSTGKEPLPPRPGSHTCPLSDPA
jgi:hypothetical protein